MEIILGLVLPPVIDLANRFVKNSKLRFVVSIAICIIAGTAVNIAKLKLISPLDALNSIGLVIASAQTMYKLFYNDSKVQSYMLGESITPVTQTVATK